ncbi:MOMP-like family protein [Waddlia chondrophila 2032/99]|uniref:MOMP-like family protein n=1 Tax=Waddlia chondrophila 2032/99 TaxID=765953 RepID=F8LBK0_9BACT|nr:MOMP-like family protein [Waddlia chondrophila 2032/99]
MSWKKWIVALSTVVFSTQFSPANAGSYSSCDTGSDCGFSFCDSDPCEGWSIYADYLYWRPRKCDLDYAITYIENGSELQEAFATGLSGICPSYDSGFRIGILKAFGDLDFGVHYTWFRSKDGSSINNVGEDFLILPTKIGGASLFVTDGIQLAASDYKIELNQVDVELGYHLELSDCLAARLFSGFRYANIKQTQDSVYSSNINDQFAESSLNQVDVIHQKADLDFYGLYVGNKASYKICDCFDFFGGLSLGIGVGEVSQDFDHKGKSIGGTDYTQADLVNESCWKSIAVLDLNVGITFPLCNVCCTDLAFSVGYEFHQWFNLGGFTSLSRTVDSEGEAAGRGLVSSNCCDLGFDGLFVRLSAAF